MNDELIKVRVVAKMKETPDIYAYELQAADGTSLPAFAAGAHIDVHLPNGLVRQYSLCNPPSETHRYVIAVLRDPKSRGGSVAMHDLVQAGEVISISAPRNHFPLKLDADETLLLAGGIGITPILSMAEALSAAGRNFSLHYGARSPESMAFREHISVSSFAHRTYFHFDDGDASQKYNLPVLLETSSAGRHVYVCGPQGFIDAVKATALARGWSADNVHYEYFGVSVVSVVGDSSFQVKIASRDETITVAANQTIVGALSSVGINVPVSCEQGVCGTCLTRVIEGVPDHRDQYLTTAEQAANDQMLLCCSRAKTSLIVLDL
ncbi:MAG: oxidoreductase [Rhodocyclaceae bacterium]|nr:MAG: oxidoreductase [Rhodocyclaceae bacterium]